MTEGLKPWASFDMRQFDVFEVVIDKIEEVSTFSIWCLECHFPQIGDVVAIKFFAIVPGYFTQEYGLGIEWF